MLFAIRLVLRVPKLIIIIIIITISLLILLLSIGCNLT